MTPTLSMDDVTALRRRASYLASINCQDWAAELRSIADRMEPLVQPIIRDPAAAIEVVVRLAGEYHRTIAVEVCPTETSSDWYVGGIKALVRAPGPDRPWSHFTRDLVKATAEATGLPAWKVWGALDGARLVDTRGAV